MGKHGRVPALDFQRRARGGDRQRMAAGEADVFARVSTSSGGNPNVSSDGHCPLSLLPMQLVKWGGISTAVSQTLAHAAVQSGASSPVLTHIANTGARASWSQKVWRDMRRRFESTPVSQALTSVGLPFKGEHGRTNYVQAAMALPHVVFAMLYHHDNDLRGVYAKIILEVSEQEL